MRRLALLLLPLVMLACAGNEKRGDRAAAVGDWKAAEREYGEALRKDPQNPEKRAKYQSARAQALQGAVAAARACQAAQNWECAFVESDYAVYLEPGDAALATLRADAARNVGVLRLRQAGDAAARRDHRAAFGLFTSGRDVSPDPAVQAEARRVAPKLVSGAVEDAERLRKAQQFPEAIQLLELAVAVDGGVRPRLDGARAEYDRWLVARYEAAAQEGDAFLQQRRFADAQRSYEAALRFKPGGRAEPLARYARGCAQGEHAVLRRDWPAATAAYDEAVRTGMDSGGFAATELERVRIRPYAIRVRTALVKPVRPDGAPWAGGRSRGFDRAVGRLVEAALDGDRKRGRRMMELYDLLPDENRPSLVATLTLPDGRAYATGPVNAFRARFEALVALDTNLYDDRPVTVRITHADPRGSIEVGAVTFRVMDALAGELDLADRSLMELRVVAEATPLRDGQGQGFALLVPPAPPAPRGVPAAAPAAHPAPAPAAR